MPTECKHGMVNGTCSFCRFEKNVVRSRQRQKSHIKSFPATYPGECSVEGDRILPGEMITAAWGGYAHINCYESR